MTQQNTIHRANIVRRKIEMMSVYDEPRNKSDLVECLCEISTETTALAKCGLTDKDNAVRFIMRVAIDGLSFFAKGEKVKDVNAFCRNQEPHLLRMLDAMMAENGYATREEYAVLRYYHAEAKAA